MRVDELLPGLPLAAPDETPPGEIMPLVGYSPFWLVLGITVLAVIVAGYLVLVLLTRPRERVVEAERPSDPPVDLVRLRDESFARIAEIERELHVGAVDPRSANEALSSLVRRYVAEATGIPADRMTLRDLRESPLRGTTAAVEQFYPSVFGAEPAHDLPRSIQLAREVIAGWR